MEESDDDEDDDDEEESVECDRCRWPFLCVVSVPLPRS